MGVVVGVKLCTKDGEGPIYRMPRSLKPSTQFLISEDILLETASLVALKASKRSADIAGLSGRAPFWGYPRLRDAVWVYAI